MSRLLRLDTLRSLGRSSLRTSPLALGTATFGLKWGRGMDIAGARRVFDSVIRVQVHVPQDAAAGVQPGVDAVIRVPELPDRTFPGNVTRIADALQPGTRTLLAEIDIANPDSVLSPGTCCTAELRIPRKTASLSIPAGAIIFNQNGLQVAAVEDGVATTVEARDGVKPGDQVILNPAVELVDGARV